LCVPSGLPQAASRSVATSRLRVFMAGPPGRRTHEVPAPRVPKRRHRPGGAARATPAWPRSARMRGPPLRSRVVVTPSPLRALLAAGLLLAPLHAQDALTAAAAAPQPLRERMLALAREYASFEWQGDARNVLHGPDAD